MGGLCGRHRDGRMRSPPGAVATRTRREKTPPMRGRRGLLEVDIIRWVLPVWVRAKARGQKAHNQQEQ